MFQEDLELRVKAIQGITVLEFKDEVNTLVKLVRRLPLDIPYSELALALGSGHKDSNGGASGSDPGDLQTGDTASINDGLQLAQQSDEDTVSEPGWFWQRAFVL